MRIGLTYTLRSSEKTAGASADDSEEEFDSPETVEAVARVLRSLGHEVELLGDGEPLLRRLLDGPRPDLAFNFAEGRGVGRCREARVPAVLEMLGVPYTGSDPLTLSVTLDKDCAKRLVAAAGVPTPQWELVSAEWEIRNAECGVRSAESSFAASSSPPSSANSAFRIPHSAFPRIVKPAFEGSSKGVFDASVVYDREQLVDKISHLRESYRQPLLVEEFIEGDELTVGVVGNSPPRVLGIMRIIPTDTKGPFVYSLEVKRDWRRRVRYECPAQLSPAETAAVTSAALDAWKALGCQDLARLDFRLRDGVPYFLEVNPLPGLSPESGDLVLLARGVGVSYEELIARILEAAMERIASSSAGSVRLS